MRVVRAEYAAGIVLLALAASACGKSSRSERGNDADGGPKVAAFHLIEPLPAHIEAARNATTEVILGTSVSFVSDDLRIVIGDSGLLAEGAIRMTEPMRWTPEGGTMELGALPGADPAFDWVGVADIDSTGSTVVGSARDASGTRAVRWTESTGILDISPPGAYEASAWFVSDDGAVVVGMFSVTIRDAAEIFRWTSASGAVALGPIPGLIGEIPYYLGPDGSVIAGIGSPQCVADGTCGQVNAFFEWSEQAGMQNIGSLPGYDSCNVNPYDVSYAPMLTGNCSGPAGVEPFVWTEADGLRGLGAMPEGVGGPSAVSEDANVALFQGYNSAGTPVAWRWTADSGASELLPTAGWDVVYLLGFRSLMSADGSVAEGTLVRDMESRGARVTSRAVEPLPLLDGYTIASPVGISRDGRTIAGTIAASVTDGSHAVVWRGDDVALVSDALAAWGIALDEGVTLRDATALPHRGLVGTAETAGGDLAWIAELPE
jgi:uncharacterized membrane protein